MILDIKGDMVHLKTNDGSMELTTVANESVRILEAFHSESDVPNIVMFDVDYLQVHVKVNGRLLTFSANARVPMESSVPIRKAPLRRRPAGGWGELC